MSGLSQKCVRSLFNEIRELIAEDIKTYGKLGGPRKIVEIDEAKFGKRKYSRGRLVDGSWVIGGGGITNGASSQCVLITSAAKLHSCPTSNRMLFLGR